ncbi:conserved hypothetical protein [Vibrio chagasii]|nr:conserved hypothetical protein [Vibrio chagasii]CAH7399300.1 conserved hypothetical protein [Vibrio chagasii]
MRLTITTKDILTIFGFSRTTLWRNQKHNNFPNQFAKGLFSRKQVIQWAIDQGMIENELSFQPLINDYLPVEQNGKEPILEEGNYHMAITLRPTDEEQKLVDYAKDVTRQSTATKAMFDIVRDHQKVTAELQRYKKLEHEASSRVRKAESTINQFQSSLTNLLNH